MTKDDLSRTIPPEAVEAAAKAAYCTWRDKIRAEERDVMDADMLDEVAPEWDNIGSSKKDWVDQTCAAIAAMLAAWPMKQFRAWDDVQGVGSFLILPLPTETDNAKS